MAKFQFVLGAATAPILDTPFRDLADLTDELGQSRYIAGNLVAADGDAIGPNALVPVCRIQMIVEVE